MRKIGLILIGLGLLVFAAVIWYTARNFPGLEKHKVEQADVVLQKVQSACKLITAEGYFSEVYDYKDYYHWDIPMLRKKALIRVKARASVGYDLQALTISADTATRTIVVGDVPEPVLLSLDHEVDYYDITEGTFNAFNAEDYTDLNARAKNFISEIAMNSELVEIADARRSQAFAMIRYIVESAGWQLVLEDRTPAPVRG